MIRTTRAVRRALVVAAALAVVPAGQAGAAVSVHSTDGVRPGYTNNSVITNAPKVIRVGAEYNDQPVVVRSSLPTEVSVTLVDPRNGPVSFDYDSNDATRHQLDLSFYSSDVANYGTWRWEVEAYDSDDSTSRPLVVATQIRANSLLGLSARRRGSSVTITVATRAWNNAAARYQGWASRGVYVQKQTSSGAWTNVGGITTNSGGNASKVIGTGPGVYRVYDKDTATVWGSTSAGARV